MSEENQLIVLPDSALAQKFDDDSFDKMAGSTYLPRLQLMTSNADVCKSGQFPINTYALVSGTTHIDVGKEVDVLIVAWRPKALDINEGVISCFDPSDAEFSRIQQKSEEPNSGCMYGPEFLVYVPSQEKFATFFMGTKSSRRESPNVKARLQNSATLTSRLIETAKFSWYAPCCKPCSTPFTLPDMSDVITEVEKFNNPPKQVVETVDESETEERPR